MIERENDAQDLLIPEDMKEVEVNAEEDQEVDPEVQHIGKEEF